MIAEARCYTVADVLERLRISRTTFERRRRAGKLPFLEELLPRLGHPRYRADLVDRYLRGEWGRGREFFTAAARRKGAR
jgi:predicted site-specific integrase-resolvase